MSSIIRIDRISELDMHILKVVWHKNVIWLLHVLNVVETTHVVMGRAVEIGAIEPNLLQLFHKTGLQLEENLFSIFQTVFWCK